MPADYIPILMQILFVIGFAVAMVALTQLIGPKKPDDVKLSVYECGVTPYTDAPARFSVKFYLVAVLFVLFDIEAIFLFPWALVFKTFVYKFGAFIFLEGLVFIGILFAGLIYVWKRGALDWVKE